MRPLQAHRQAPALTGSQRRRGFGRTHTRASSGRARLVRRRCVPAEEQPGRYRRRPSTPVRLLHTHAKPGADGPGAGHGIDDTDDMKILTLERSGQCLGQAQMGPPLCCRPAQAGQTCAQGKSGPDAAPYPCGRTSRRQRGTAAAPPAPAGAQGSPYARPGQPAGIAHQTGLQQLQRHAAQPGQRCSRPLPARRTASRSASQIRPAAVEGPRSIGTALRCADGRRRPRAAAGWRLHVGHRPSVGCVSGPAATIPSDPPCL